MDEMSEEKIVIPIERRLKPCPFCGSEAVHTESSYFRDTLIYCENCDAYFTVDSFAADEHDVIEAWNRRTERTAKVETVEKPNVYKCSECGQYFHSTAWGSPVEYCSRCGAKLDWSGNE